MNRLERTQALIPIIAARKHKAELFDTIMPDMLASGVKLANGDYDKARQITAMSAPLIGVMTVRDWAHNMYTEPGEFVYDPQKKHIYQYAGKDAMTHSNQTYYPGANGVYYWSIVPDMHEDIKVFPNVTGIVVFVKNDELWWNNAKTQQYRWTGANYQCPYNHYPGAAGVHSWVAV